jgi:hypothetical protein
MGIDHVLDRIGDELARGQAVEHAAMAHGDAVVDGDGIELLGHAARLLDLASHQLPQILEVNVPRNELSERVCDRDDGLAEVVLLHPRGAPQGPGARHVAAMCGGSGAILGHLIKPARLIGGPDRATLRKLRDGWVDHTGAHMC